ncbi:glycoside hydrolase [Oceanicola sp. 22II-s10i]|uniref:glycoside hydrolase family 25 protein n=1 Tax=Oceanicola sp. 22II-s10i TaxID=1317116 RepID=UPI000B523638|nr:GH25 family lysozyme [Oceanicola sp. 22II-s10i]OWU84584.1 glycoside hydrolase [Oceanicola sp. 22II-s10i]
MIRRGMIAALASALLLAGCGGDSEIGGGETRSQPVIRHAPGLPAAFGDADPHGWEGRTPASYPVHGLDTARFQGQVDWDRARAAGVRFAWIKATEGGDLLDPEFRGNWRGAGRAGVPRGAYHFYYWCRPAAEQAAWFIRNVPKEAGALPPVLDMEWTPFSPTCTIRPPAETVRAEALIFLRALERHYGTKPVIYSTPDFFERNEMYRLRSYDFWLRSTAGHPSRTYPGHPWTFWQYTGTGLVPGVYTKVDINIFNGSAAAFDRWLATRRQ